MNNFEVIKTPIKDLVIIQPSIWRRKGVLSGNL